MKRALNFQSGLTLVEVVIASAIILTAVLTLLGVHNFYLKSALSNAETVKAVHLMEEGIEAMRYFRDDSWEAKVETLSLNTPYGLVLSGGTWQTTSNLWVGSFTRSVTLASVQRNASGDIVSSGGALDPDTLLVTATVSWPSRGATTTKAMSTYLTNLYGN